MKQVSFGFQEIASVKSASNDRLFSGDCFGKRRLAMTASFQEIASAKLVLSLSKETPRNDRNFRLVLERT